MKYLIGGITLACALLAHEAQAVPVQYRFSGTVQQSVFDPGNPFPFPLEPGTAIHGRVRLDTTATDQVPGDPNVGAYTFTQGEDAPYSILLSLGLDGLATSFLFDSFTVGIVNGPVMDQYTIFGQRGDPSAPGGYAGFEMRFDYAPDTFDSDALVAVPPRIVPGMPASFMLTGAIDQDGELYQYELMGTIGTVVIPEPASLALMLIGAGACGARQRRRATSKIPQQ